MVDREREGRLTNRSLEIPIGGMAQHPVKKAISFYPTSASWLAEEESQRGSIKRLSLLAMPVLS
jgi:hypothetical protein